MNYRGSGLQLLLMHHGEEIASFNVSGDFKTNITRSPDLLATKLASLNDTLIIFLKSNQYSSHKTRLDEENSLTKIYYHDPFSDPEALDDFHNTDGFGLESSLEEGGIGWQDPNTMLLSFAAGESVGEATKHFQSFSLINLGDPVASLKALKYTFSGTNIEKSFDPTVGELVQEQ